MQDAFIDLALTNTGGPGPNQFADAEDVLSYTRQSEGQIIAYQFRIEADFVHPTGGVYLGQGPTGNVNWGIDNYALSPGGGTGGIPYILENGANNYFHVMPAYGSGFYESFGLPGREVVWGNESAYNAWLAYYASDYWKLSAAMKDTRGVTHLTWRHYGAVQSLFASSPTLLEARMVVGRIWYWGLPVETPPPPTNPDFCAEVNDGQLDNGASDIGIELPSIMVGPARCHGFAGYQASVGSWEVDWPPLQLCMKPVQFGQFDLFGLVVSIDSLLATMAGILLVRWVLRS